MSKLVQGHVVASRWISIWGNRGRIWFISNSLRQINEEYRIQWWTFKDFPESLRFRKERFLGITKCTQGPIIPSRGNAFIRKNLPRLPFIYEEAEASSRGCFSFAYYNGRMKIKYLLSEHFLISLINYSNLIFRFKFSCFSNLDEFSTSMLSQYANWSYRYLTNIPICKDSI